MPEGPLPILDADHKPVEDSIKQLKSTLQSDQYHNLPLKVVSVTGMMRCGKSTTMNLFMKQLRAHEATRQPIDKLCVSFRNNTELTGFPRDAGMEAVTHGVYIWSRPFIVSDEDGHESAVLLMDVEGAFDGATIVESAPIFVFAALVSSAVLLNVEKKIDELVIQLLDCFVATSNAKLQDVTIVVRDVTLAQTFGFAPGKELLEKKMKVTDSMNDVMRTSRERIRQVVSNLLCFLMPYPGERATEQNDWTNTRSKFLSCTSDLLCEVIRRPKLVGEQPLTCANFVTFMKPFFTVFARDQQPSPTTLFDALRESTNREALRRVVDSYRRDIHARADDIGLEDAHSQLQGVAIEHLQHVQSPEVRLRLTTELKATLEEIRNSIAKDKKLKIAIGLMTAAGVAAATTALPAAAVAAVPALSSAMAGAVGTTVVAVRVTMGATAAMGAVTAAATAMGVKTQESKGEKEEETK